MKEGSHVIILDENQIQEFQEFILEIPGKFANPILAKLHTYKRVVKATRDVGLDSEHEKLQHFEEGNPVPINEPTAE